MIIVCNPAVCVCNWALNEHTHTLLQDLTTFDSQQMRCLFLINTLLEIMTAAAVISSASRFSLSLSSKKVMNDVSFSLAGSHVSRQVGEGNVRIAQWTSRRLWSEDSCRLDGLSSTSFTPGQETKVWPSTVCYGLTAPWLWLSLKGVYKSHSPWSAAYIGGCLPRQHPNWNGT